MLSCTVDEMPRSEASEHSDTCWTAPQSDRALRIGRPLKTLFLLTSMPVGGAELLLVNMLRRFRSDRIAPAVACTKELGPLGESIADEFPVTSRWLRYKSDIAVVPRLVDFMRREKFDAVITVGAGDKMFWGRLAARFAKVPVICSALHSTGWPDGVGRLNRWLTPWTDRYIAVAKAHGDFLVSWERFPKRKVVVIPNGVDTDRFRPDPEARTAVRQELGLLPSTPLVGIVAALRPEKNHSLFVELARRVLHRYSNARFLIIGEGSERTAIESVIARHSLQDHVLLLGSRSDTPRLVASLDAFVLTSHNEAFPVSILEALSCSTPVVATQVGSVSEAVIHDWNGFTVAPGDIDSLTRYVSILLSSTFLAESFGRNGRDHVVSHFSLEAMVQGYEDLIASVFLSKLPAPHP